MSIVMVNPNCVGCCCQVQYARPDSDTASGNFEDATGGDNDGLLWDEVDEVSADDATTFIRAPVSFAGGSSVTWTLTNVTDPGHDLGHKIRFRGRATNRILLGIIIVLKQGGTAIYSWNVSVPPFSANNTWETVEQIIPTVNFANINDFNAINLDVSISISVGGSDVDITHMELELVCP